ncbi:DNA cross-link repair 1A protein-like [Panonychus citri]|uniref:DNA cross-link repair 1A protein-like n=1 Tax=Panonychus citri TaxID=50023 RepID=UPI002307A145|nr:DNA cross-link repair 1A protein-like [Panonychus citri]
MTKQLKITAFMKPKPEKKKIEADEFGVITIDDDTSFRKFDDDDFVEDYGDIKRKKNSSIKSANSQMRDNTNPNNNNTNDGPRKCPFYKKIPGTKFAVDAFNFGLIPGIQFYFLSHFHYDHYIGLKKSFIGTIVCSPITGRLVMSQIGIAENQLIMIDIHQPIMIDGVQIIAIDAFHCPGAVLFLMNLPNGKRILHTGDFRASPAMEKDIYLTEKPIDQIYLDTTYCDPNYKFPAQDETLQAILNITKDHLEKYKQTLIVCGTYSIGKEKVFKIICSSLSLNLWVTTAKLKLLKCIDDKEINSYLVTDKTKAQVHVLPMKDINQRALREYLSEFGKKYSSVLAFKPTGWTEDGKSLSSVKPIIRDNISIYGIPYSEHSSYSELERFIKFFKPKTITPTVNVGNQKKRESMFKIFADWKTGDKKR